MTGSQRWAEFTSQENAFDESRGAAFNCLTAAPRALFVEQVR